MKTIVVRGAGAHSGVWVRVPPSPQTGVTTDLLEKSWDVFHFSGFFCIFAVDNHLDMGIFEKLFGKKARKSETKDQMFGEIPLENFKAALLVYYKQECALEDENSYFEPQDSLFGEMFDNGIRIKLLKQENPQLEGQYDDDEIMAQARAQYEKDKAELEEKKKKDGEDNGQGTGEASGDEL